MCGDRVPSAIVFGVVVVDIALGVFAIEEDRKDRSRNVKLCRFCTHCSTSGQGIVSAGEGFHLGVDDLTSEIEQTGGDSDLLVENEARVIGHLQCSRRDKRASGAKRLWV